MKKHNILIVDDEQDIVDLLYDILSKNELYIIQTRNNGKEALDLVKKEDFDLVITDVKMPEMDGISLLKEIKKINQSIYVLVITAFGSIPMAVEAIKHEAYDFITKPFSGQMIKLLVEKILENIELQKINKQYLGNLKKEYSIENVIGYTKDNKELKNIIKNIIKKHISIFLIEGKKFSGKTYFAKAYHYSINNKSECYEIDIEEYSENNLYKKIFGDLTTPGLLEIAESSTLIIKHIDKLPRQLQIKLYRFLSDGEILPQNSNSPKIININLNIIFTSRENLKILVHKNKFNKLLYEKISISTVHILSLSDSKKYFKYYLNEFLRYVAFKNSFKLKQVDNETYKLLFNYNWKEDKKELLLVLEKACAISNHKQIIKKDLPVEILSENNKFIYPTLEEVEKKFISEILDYTSGNKSIAADLMGIHRRQLYRKLEKYNMVEIKND